jgi:hypothetical protein
MQFSFAGLPIWAAAGTVRALRSMQAGFRGIRLSAHLRRWKTRAGDGSRHLEQEEYDEERTVYLRSLGYQVIRFWNNQVLRDIESVIQSILHTIESNQQ